MNSIQALADAQAAEQVLLASVKELSEALQWCGGSADFGPGGQARVGWETSVQPVLKRAIEAIEMAKS